MRLRTELPPAASRSRRPGPLHPAPGQRPVRRRWQSFPPGGPVARGLIPGQAVLREGSRTPSSAGLTALSSQRWLRQWVSRLRTQAVPCDPSSWGSPSSSEGSAVLGAPTCPLSLGNSLPAGRRAHGGSISASHRPWRGQRVWEVMPQLSDAVQPEGVTLSSPALPSSLSPHVWKPPSHPVLSIND